MARAMRTARPFDFRQSHLLGGDQMRTLERVSIHWANLLATYLTAFLRGKVTCSVGELTQRVFEDLLNTLPERAVMATADLDPLPGVALLRIDGVVAHAYIDRLLGGSNDVVPVDRALTEIDSEVLVRGLPIVFDALSEAWTSIEKIHAQVHAVDVTPQFLRVVSLQDSVVEIPLELGFAGVSGFISLILSHELLKPVLFRLSSAAQLSEPDEAITGDAEDTRRLRSLIKGASVEVSVVLGDARISVRDFLALEPGDVVVLAQKAHEPLRVEVQGVPKFRGQPQARGRRLNLVIADVVQTRAKGGRAT